MLRGSAQGKREDRRACRARTLARRRDHSERGGDVMSTLKIPKDANFKGAVRKAEETLEENLICDPPINVYELASNYGVRVQHKPFPDEIRDISGFIITICGTA